MRNLPLNPFFLRKIGITWSPPYFKLFALVLAERYDWLFRVFCTSRVKFEPHKEEIKMADSVYWMSDGKLLQISDALELFRNHDGWKGRPVELPLFQTSRFCASNIIKSNKFVLFLQ